MGTSINLLHTMITSLVPTCRDGNLHPDSPGLTTSNKKVPLCSITVNIITGKLQHFIRFLGENPDLSLYPEKLTGNA